MNYYDILNSLQPQSGGMPRRPDDEAAPTPEAQINDAYGFYNPSPDATSVSRGLAQGLINLKADYYTGKGLYQGLAGNAAARDEAFNQAQELHAAGVRAGPTIQSYKDVHSVGDALGYAGGLFGSAIPDLALMATGGGAAASVGKGLARRGIAKAAEELGASAAERAAATGVIEATPEAKAAFAAEKAVDAARTLKATSGAQKALQTAEHVGHAVGTTAGALPGALGSQLDTLTDKESTDSFAARAGKAGLGALVVASLNALPINRLLSRAGTPLATGAAQEGVQKATAHLIPRVAAEVAKQGLAMGALGVASTAATLATHKWVNDHIQLLTPQTFDQYIDSFIGGAALGGVLGGGVEALRPTGRPGLLERTKARLRNLYVEDPDAPDPGEGGAPPPKPPAASGIEVNENDPAAVEAFQRHLGTIDRQDELEGLDVSSKDLLDAADRRYQAILAGEAQPQLGAPATRAMKGFPTKLQGMLAAFVPLDHPLRGDRDALKPLVASAEKLFHVEPSLTDQDRHNLTLLGRAVGDDTIKRWAAAGPEYARALKLAEETEAAPENTAMRDAMKEATEAQQAEIEQQKTKQESIAAPEESDASEAGKAVDATGAPIDDSVENLGYDIKELPQTDLRDKLTQVNKDSNEGRALQKELGDRIAKEGYTFTENYTAPEKWKAALASNDPYNKPNAVLGTVDTPHGPRQRIFRLENLVTNEIKRSGGGISPHDALMNVFKDLKLAGVELDPKSITKGEVWQSSDGTQTARLNGNDIALLRKKPGVTPTREQAAQMRKVLAREVGQDPSQLEKGTPKPLPKKEREATLNHEYGREDTRDQTHRNTFDEKTGKPIKEYNEQESDQEVGLKAESEPHELKARREPASISEKLSGEHSPYETLLARVRRLKPEYGVAPDGTPYTIRRGASPAVRRALAIDVGREIGRKEIAKQNLPEYAEKKALRFLEDNDEHALKYYNRAVRGEFDSAKVEEARQDAGTPLRGKEADKPERVEATHNNNPEAPRGVSEAEAKAAKADVEQRLSRTMDKLRSKLSKFSKRVDSRDVENDRPKLKLVESDELNAMDDEVLKKVNEVLETVQQKPGESDEAYGERFMAAMFDMAAKESAKEFGLEKKPGETDDQFQERALGKAFDSLYGTEEEIKNGKLTHALKEVLVEVGHSDAPGIDQFVNRPFAANDPRFADRIIDGVEETADPNRRPQVHKETDMLNRMIEKLGLKGKIAPVKVTVLPERLRQRGDYNPMVGPDGVHEIRINSTLRGAPRIEVLTHELGHHIVFQMLGTALKPKELRGLKGADLLEAQKHNALLDALTKDYQEWRMKHDVPSAKVTDVEASRKPFFGAKDREMNSTGKTLIELFDEDMLDETKPGKGRYDYLLSAHEWLADHIARTLTGSEHGQGVIGEFFKGIVDTLKRVYRTMFGTEEAKKYAPAPSVEAWINGLFDANAFRSKPSIAGFRKFETWFNATISKSARRILYRALERGVVERKLNAVYGGVDTLRTVMENNQTRLAALTYLAMHEMAAGRLKLGPSIREPIRAITDVLHRVTGIAGANELATRLLGDIKKDRVGAGYDVREEDLATKSGKRAQAQRIFNTLDKGYQKAITRAVTPLWWGVHDRINRTQIPALLKIASLVRLHSSDPGKPGEKDMLHERLQRTQQFLENVGDHFKDLTKDQKAELMHALQTQQTEHANPTIDASLKGIHKETKAWYAYATKAGIKMGETKNYFPVAMDPEEVAKRAPEFKSLIMKFEKQARNKMQMPEGDIAQAFYNAATGESADDGVPNWKAPAFSAKNNRLLDFIYKDGSKEDIEKLASFQKKDPAEVIPNYLTQLTNRAEFARRFGEDGSKLNEMLDEARKQGADDYDIRLTRDFINAAVGHYGAEGDRMFERFSKAIGGKFDDIGKPLNRRAQTASGLYSKQAQKVYDGLMTFQNINKLPLALLSSIADPLGIFVRAGGSFHGGFKALKEGLLALKKNRPSQLKDLARAIGISEDYLNLESLRNNYGGGDISTKARAVNDWMFKYNGLTGWSKALRYMALSVGQGFLLRHAQGYNSHSKRYLFELGVKPEDIKRGRKAGTIKILTEDQRAKASPEELARDERVRNALFRFVEQSILRTDVAQHPLWMNDPLMRVFAQYKQFGYALESQIIDRVLHEGKYYKNWQVLAPFLAYAPVTMLAEMVRSGIQYGPGGNPQHEDWGPAEHLAWGAERSGIYGPKVEAAINNAFGVHHGVPERGILDLGAYGPTAQTADQFLATVRGKRSLDTEALSLAPGAPLYSHWGMSRKETGYEQ